MKKMLRRLLHNPEGQSVIEYGLLLSLVVLVIVTLLTAVPGHPGGLLSAAALAASR